MSKRAGLATGGIVSALGVVVCVACVGCKDHHAPHSAVLSDGWANRSGSAPFSTCSDAPSQSTLDRGADGGVQIHLHLPQEAMAAGGPAVIVTVTLPDSMPATSLVPSGLIEELCPAGIETRM
jgi:hypothetical protein